MQTGAASFRTALICRVIAGGALAVQALAAPADPPPDLATRPAVAVAPVPAGAESPATTNRLPQAAPIRVGTGMSSGVEEIAKLARAGVDSRVIRAFVDSAAPIPRPSAAEVIYLAEQGVPSDILTAMIQRATEPGVDPPPAPQPVEAAAAEPAPRVTIVRVPSAPAYSYVAPPTYTPYYAPYVYPTVYPYARPVYWGSAACGYPRASFYTSYRSPAHVYPHTSRSRYAVSRPSGFDAPRGTGGRTGGGLPPRSGGRSGGGRHP